VTGAHPGRNVADLVHERDNIAVPVVTMNFWAGARAAAGTASESVEAGSVEEALDAVLGRHDDPRFTRVVRASSLLVDGVAASADSVRRPLEEATVVEVLPPFAGG
jgi:molybdopterin synthase sulfur carrier subunit